MYFHSLFLLLKFALIVESFQLYSHIYILLGKSIKSNASRYQIKYNTAKYSRIMWILFIMCYCYCKSTFLVCFPLVNLSSIIFFITNRGVSKNLQGSQLQTFKTLMEKNYQLISRSTFANLEFLSKSYLKLWKEVVGLAWMELLPGQFSQDVCPIMAFLHLLEKKLTGRLSSSSKT